jgi:2-polyprenyl-3-methyl-5-hydroxy-6-metoxy-1,4-benzoquinol methylase
MFISIKQLTLFFAKRTTMMETSSQDMVALNENEGQGIDSSWSPEEKAFFLEFINASPSETILDLGCGNGVFSKWLHEIGCAVIGMDFSFKALRNASAFQMMSVQSSAPILPFAANSFDRVLLIEVLEHIPPQSEQQFLREILRILKPGGKLILHTSPNIVAEKLCMVLNPFVFLAKIFGLTKRSLFRIETSVDEIHINKHSPKTLSIAIRKSGFHGQVQAYTSFCTFPYRLVKRFRFLEHPLLSNVFGLRFRGTLIKPQSS